MTAAATAPAAEAGTYVCKGVKAGGKLKANCAKGWTAGKDKQGTLYGECKQSF